MTHWNTNLMAPLRHPGDLDESACDVHEEETYIQKKLWKQYVGGEGGSPLIAVYRLGVMKKPQG